MIKKAQHQQLENFYRALTALRDPFTGVADAGLIVAPSKYNLDEFYPPGNTALITLDDKSNAEETREKLAAVLEAGAGVCFELKTHVLPQWFYGLLRELTSIGQAEFHNFRGRENFTLKPAGEARLLVITTNQILEKLPMNTFLGLFGPIIRL